MNNKGNVMIFIYILIGIIAMGTIGYQIVLDVSFIDAFYMTIITISTVGYTEVAQMDADAKLFSVFLIIVSLGSVGYLFTRIVSSLMEGDVREAIRRRIMEKKIEGFKDHYILCGASEVGWNAIKRFQKSNADLVVIDQNESIIKELTDMGIPALKGDATQDEVLIDAGIHSAKGLLTSLSNDADNVFTVLTARELNKKLYIVSKAIDRKAHDKLKIAGANNTISPDEIGGSRMAALMLNPTVISFLDIITYAGEVVLDLEDVVICENSEIANMNLREMKIPEKTGLTVLAVKKRGSEKLQFNPSSNETLVVGDTMIVLGREEQVFELRKLASDDGTREL